MQKPFLFEQFDEVDAGGLRLGRGGWFDGRQLAVDHRIDRPRRSPASRGDAAIPSDACQLCYEPQGAETHVIRGTYIVACNAFFSFAGLSIHANR
jgi:hypothetical protein